MSTMFRKASTQVFASRVSAAHTSSSSSTRRYATLSHDESFVVKRWYESLQLGQTSINKSHGDIAKTKNGTTFRYPLKALLDQVPETIHSRLKQSMYLKSVPVGDVICIPIEKAKNSEDRENFGWDKLNTIIHEAALSVVLGSKTRKRVSKLLKDKIVALKKETIEFREGQAKMLSDKDKERLHQSEHFSEEKRHSKKPGHHIKYRN